MNTLDRMLNNPIVRATFKKEDDDEVSYLLNVLEALFDPIVKGDKFLDGYRDWEVRTCDEYFRKDFHSTAFLKVPTEAKSNEKEDQSERPSNEQENRQGLKRTAGLEPVRAGLEELNPSKLASEIVSDVPGPSGCCDGVGEDRCDPEGQSAKS